ncbi:alpha-isopropylmalate synthase regulatory domain-containing protein, partial [Candidatus Magnetaquicoccus inordinatus]|uniref:alpha-isopropylmalate synthase regulatory domain-containing protein n=1 Tax=Candidatus Magnetaquicoccus inordinatus TaxID=2496818 RepID=UPI002A4E188F
ALLAGAERVEGALFGNGERTGNVDIVTLAMNLYSQGLPIGLDFAHMEELVACYESCTGMMVPPRQPYAGELVFTAFSGSHQDAIRKGLAAWQSDQPWEVPYLPIDPRDVGSDWSALIRVNSQSGKAGALHLLELARGVQLPKALHREFAQLVQAESDRRGVELTQSDVEQIFLQELCQPAGKLQFYGYQLLQEREQLCTVELQIGVGSWRGSLTGRGNGPLDAAAQALPGAWKLDFYQEQALQSGSQAQAIAFISLLGEKECRAISGVGIDCDIVAASLRALLAALNRHLSGYGEEELQRLVAAWSMGSR